MDSIRTRLKGNQTVGQVINSHRILVTGERIIPTPQSDLRQAGASPDVPGPPWWAVGLGATTTVLVGYVWRMGFAGRQRS